MKDREKGLLSDGGCGSAGKLQGERGLSFRAGEFAGALREYEAADCSFQGKIGSYAHLIWSTNTEDPALGKLLQEARELGAELSQKLVFFRCGVDEGG
jgi:oligoendopeptidase F